MDMTRLGTLFRQQGRNTPISVCMTFHNLELTVNKIDVQICLFQPFCMQRRDRFWTIHVHFGSIRGNSHQCNPYLMAFRLGWIILAWLTLKFLNKTSSNRLIAVQVCKLAALVGGAAAKRFQLTCQKQKFYYSANEARTKRAHGTIEL